MPNLSHLNVGDLIAIRESSRPWLPKGVQQPSHRILKITRKTATQLKAEQAGKEITVRMSDGMTIGGHSHNWAEEATPEILANVKSAAKMMGRYTNVSLRLINWVGKPLHKLDLTVDQMERLAKAWDEIQAMAPKG